MRALLILTFLTSGLMACAPKHGARASADPQAALATRLNARGVPDASWSEAELTSYEVDLMRLEATDHGANAALIRSRRESLDQVREKRVGKAFRASHANGAESQAAPLLRERDDLVRDVNVAGKPDSSWTTEQLLGLTRKLARIDELGRRLRDQLGLNTLSYDEFTKLARVPLNRQMDQRRRQLPWPQVKGDILM